MSSAGWFPDPAGAPGRYRYWDGQAWSAGTTADPLRTPVPPPPGAAAQAASGHQRRASDRGWLAALAVLVVLTLVLVAAVLLAGGVLPGRGGVAEDSNSAAPTVPGWDETSTPTPTTPPPSFTAGVQVACPVTRHSAGTAQTGGRIWSGRLNYAGDPGWANQGIYLGFTYDLHGQQQTVTSFWFADTSVSRLSREDWPGDIGLTAVQIAQCVSTSGYYSELTGVEAVSSVATTVSGYPAWHVRANAYVSSPPTAVGDRIDIIVVDTGDPDEYALFQSACTIGHDPAFYDDTTCESVDRAIASLAVD